MKILKYNDLLNENQSESDYAVGEIVMIRYGLSGDVCPVKIIKKISRNNFIVSHKVENSYTFGADDQEVKKSEIMGRYRGASDSIDTNRTTENPRIQPDVSGMVPGWNSWSNDIAF